MIAEYNFAGIYLASAPATAAMALLVALAVHRLLAAARFYRWVWHPALFDAALFVVIWAAIVLLLLPAGHGHD